MCTVATYHTKDHYFGRNLDLEYSYHETVTITPRQYPFEFRKMGRLDVHYAIIGMAYVVDGYPLYYDATNEKGLSMAGLNFPGYAEYQSADPEKENVSPFEFIPWILSQCATLQEVKEKLKVINLVKINFSEQLPLSPLHWMISDSTGSITVECTRSGMHVYENSVGILTNNPPFEYQLFNLNNYMHVTPKQPMNCFSDRIELEHYSLGMGGIGLPGDLSSSSRFVKAAFTRLNAISGDSESESISQFFHILDSVKQQRGCNEVREGEYEITLYTSCCNTTKGIYYYKTYENSQISAVNLFHENLESDKLVSYPLIQGQQICYQN